MKMFPSVLFSLTLVSLCSTFAANIFTRHGYQHCLAAIRGGEDMESDLHASVTLQSLILEADKLLSQKDVNGAFATLAKAYPMDPMSPKIAAMFQTCMEINIETAQSRFNAWLDTSDEIEDDFSEEELTNLFQDRMGLASLCIDKEKYDQAGIQLNSAIKEASVWLNQALNLGRKKSNHCKLPDLASTRFQHWQPQIDQALYLLYRTNAACCKWDTYFEDGDALRKSLERTNLSTGHVLRLLHPFDALKFPCVSLELASRIAESYAYRALESVGVSMDSNSFVAQGSNLEPRRVVTAIRSRKSNVHTNAEKKVRVGYLSPDFTSRHPLAFLMQHVFHCHDKSRFSVYIYSLSSSCNDEGPEVKQIRESSDNFTYLSTSMSPTKLYKRIMQDELDILVDLCGYAGTSLVAEIMASRYKLQQKQDEDLSQKNIYFPIHVAYMGFPGSMGHDKIWDYSVFDKTVISPSLRRHYTGALVYMPHCYFVNSHKTVIGGPNDGVLLVNEVKRKAMRQKYGIHPSAFVYCCHSRPDKIDPSTFRSWMNALWIARKTHTNNGVDNDALPILWLLRSGSEMELNLKTFVKREFGDDLERALVFADVVERNEHLKRLGCADVFLDTPAYGAHTLGCDAIYMGMPMISLYRTAKDVEDTLTADSDSNLGISSQLENRLISTEKLASIVGASLLYSISLDEFVVHDMESYQNLMVKCATDICWFDKIRERLVSLRNESPLFDTNRWVKNLETAYLKMKTVNLNEIPDISVTEE